MEGQAPRSSFGRTESNSRIYSKILEEAGGATKEPWMQDRIARGN
jgi:hypothetical protein